MIYITILLQACVVNFVIILLQRSVSELLGQSCNKSDICIMLMLCTSQFEPKQPPPQDYVEIWYNLICQLANLAMIGQICC